MIKNRGAAWAFIVLMGVVSFGSWLEFSKRYHPPHSYRQSAAETSKDKNESTDYVATAFAAGKFLDDHNGAVGAVATIVIALLTAVLAYVTTRQARLTREAIDLSRDEFAATHRPRIFAQSVLLNRGAGRDGTDSVNVVIANGGESDAIISDYVIYPYRKTLEAVFLPRLVRPDPIHLPLGVVVKPGESLMIAADRHGVALGAFEYERGTRIFALGQITYRGSDGIDRVTGFCREYFADEGMWRPVPDSDQEYTY